MKYNKMYKKIIIIFMTISMILFVITINKTTKAVNGSDKIIITGKIADNNNQNIGNVEVSFIDTSTNTIVEKVTTDSTR